MTSSRSCRTSVNTKIKMTKNAARTDFSMEDAEKELRAMSNKVSRVITKSYLEGYPDRIPLEQLLAGLEASQ